MRHPLATFAILATVACSDGDGPSGLDTTPLTLTPAAIDAQGQAFGAVFADPAIQAFFPGTAELREATLQRTTSDEVPAIVDPTTNSVIPPALRGRVFTFGLAGWTSAPSATAPGNGAVITVYPSLLFGGGTPVGTLTVLDSTAGTLGVASLPLRNAAGAVVLRGRVTENLLTSRITSISSIGPASGPTATLADTFDVARARLAGRITLAGAGGQWYMAQSLDNESDVTVELVSGGATLRAVTVPLAAGRDSTALTLDGRFLGYFTNSTTLQGATNAAAPALAEAFVRFAQNARQPNFLSISVSTALFLIITTLTASP